MGIYFRDILLIRISRGANNCGQHSLEKNSYFTMRFSPHFQLFYFNDRLEFCDFFEWKIKRINNADLFSQPPLLIFIKGANISGGHCMSKSGAIISVCTVVTWLCFSSCLSRGLAFQQVYKPSPELQWPTTPFCYPGDMAQKEDNGLMGMHEEEEQDKRRRN